MNTQKPPMSPRAKILVSSVRLTTGAKELVYGDPRINMACAGELKRVFFKYAAKSPRRVGPGEHEAVDQVLSKIARIATGPIVHEDTYVDGAAYMAIAGECALVGTTEARSVMDREAEDEANAEATDIEIDEQSLLEEQ